MDIENYEKLEKLWSQYPDIKFCRVRKVGEPKKGGGVYKGKEPKEPSWQKNPHTFTELKPFLLNNENYGVIGGIGNLAIIDCDEPGVLQKVKSILPDSMTVKTAKGHHVYYFCEDFKKKVVMTDEQGKHWGEVQSTGTMVVGPGSTHESGSKYELQLGENNSLPDIQTIPLPNLENAIQSFRAAPKPISAPVSTAPKIKPAHIPLFSNTDNNYNFDEVDVDQIQITDVWPITEGMEHRANGDYMGAHPVHGSTGGKNFHINPDNNTWFCHRCHPPKVLVPTPIGFKRIETIKPGDLIYNKKFQPQKVTDTVSFKNKKKVYELKTYVRDIKLTSDHPIQIASIKYKDKHLLKANPIISWKFPEEINIRKDFLVVPKIHTVTVREINGITLDKDLGYALGWYTAEGHLPKRKDRKNESNGVAFTLNIHKQKEAQKILDCLFRKFKVNGTIRTYPKRGTVIINIHCKEFRQIIKDTIGIGSSTKSLKQLIGAPVPFLDALLKTYIEGDGCLTKSGSQRVTSTSLLLIKEIQMLLFKRGIPARHYKRKPTAAHHFICYDLQWQTNPIHKSEFQDKDNLYLPIRGLVEEKADKVYSIETEDHTYLLPFIVHNCQSGGGALSAVAVAHGIVECHEVQKGSLRDDNARAAIKIAQENGWGIVQAPVLDLANLDMAEVSAELKKKEKAKPKEMTLETRTFSQFRNLQKDNNYFVKGFILPKTVTMIYSPPGQFKSFLSLYLGMCIAAGEPWLNLETKQNNVLYLDAENNDQILKERMEGIFKGNGFSETEDGSEPLPKLHIAKRVVLMDNKKNIHIGWVNALARKIRDENIKIVFLDTLHRYCGYDENSSDDVNKLYTEIFQPLIEQFGVSIVFLHHSSKAGGYRGSGDFLGMVDTAYSVTKAVGRPGDILKGFTFRNEKNRAGEQELITGNIEFEILEGTKTEEDGKDDILVKIHATDAKKTEEQASKEIMDNHYDSILSIFVEGIALKKADIISKLEAIGVTIPKSTFIRRMGELRTQNKILYDEKARTYALFVWGQQPLS